MLIYYLCSFFVQTDSDDKLLGPPTESSLSLGTNNELVGATVAKISLGQRCAVTFEGSTRYGTVAHVFHKNARAKNPPFTHRLNIGEKPIRDGLSALKVLCDDGEAMWVLFPHPDVLILDRVIKGMVDTGPDRGERLRTHWALQLLSSTSWAQVAMCSALLASSLKKPSDRVKRSLRPRE